MTEAATAMLPAKRALTVRPVTETMHSTLLLPGDASDLNRVDALVVSSA